MTKFTVSRRLPYSVDQIYHIAGDVSSYKDFLPLVKKSAVKNVTNHPGGRVTFEAELVVAYSKLGIRETFVSQVEVDPKTRVVKAHSAQGPVRSLDSVWTFVSHGPRDTEIQYTVDYTLKSRSLQFLISGMFDLIMRKVISAFEARARKLYGKAAA